MGRFIQAQGKIINDHTANFKTLQDTIHFQAAFIGELGEDVAKMQKELEQLQKTSFVRKEALDKTSKDIDARITRRREEFDGLAAFVSCQGLLL